MPTHILTAPPSPTTMLIAEDHPVYRKGLIEHLSHSIPVDDIQVAGDGQEAWKLICQSPPDLLLTDVRMPIMSGIELIRKTCAHFPQVHCIGFSSDASENLVVDLFKAGAKGYLPKCAEVSEFSQAIAMVLKGEIYLHPKAAQYSAPQISYEHSSSTSDPFKQAQFTTLERQIIKLTCQQLSVKEIADQISHTKKSVDTARERIRTKIGAKNVVGIVMYAMRKNMLGLISLYCAS